MDNNEIATKIVEGALGKCNIKQQRFIAKVVLGEDPIEIIMDQYNIGDSDMAEIKKIQLMSTPEIRNAIIELQGSSALLTKAKLNSMLPDAMKVLDDTIKDESEGNKYLRLATSKDVVKMGLDMHKADAKGNEKPTTIIKIDNINAFGHEKDMAKIANSFMGGVIDAEIEEVEVVDEVIEEKEEVVIEVKPDDDCPY